MGLGFGGQRRLELIFPFARVIMPRRGCAAGPLRSARPPCLGVCFVVGGFRCPCASVCRELCALCAARAVRRRGVRLFLGLSSEAQPLRRPRALRSRARRFVAVLPVGRGGRSLFLRRPATRPLSWSPLSCFFCRSAATFPSRSRRKLISSAWEWSCLCISRFARAGALPCPRFASFATHLDLRRGFVGTPATLGRTAEKTPSKEVQLVTRGVLPMSRLLFKIRQRSFKY